ncbi:MAG TPA: AAA family ATPase [Gaiellaceae bacterium]
MSEIEFAAPTVPPLTETELAALNGARPATSVQVADWLVDAADLLAEPDPGPTPWLVEDLIVDRALVAAVGRWKTTKSYGLLEIAIAIVTGRQAFGRCAVDEPGPVVFVIEESGRDALWRRLDSLSRGRAIPREELRGLKLAANAGVKLDDQEWQQRLIDIGQLIRPRLFVFDPLARMKASTRKENEQDAMAEPIEFIRALREATGAAVAFVQHTGHQGDHMRGTSDLESVWETRLQWKKTGDTVELTNEHREAEAGPKLEYRLNWDHETRTIRLEAEEDDAPDDETVNRVKAYLGTHPEASGSAVAKDLGMRKKTALDALKLIRGSGSGNRPEPSSVQAVRVVPPDAPFRGLGNHAEQPVPELPLGDDEVERLAQLGREMQ